MEAIGLWAALDELAATTSEQSGVCVTFDCPEWVLMPDHANALPQFRIAQKAASNALRHGRPRNIELSIHSDAKNWQLRIRDDGMGIQAQPKENKGLGIRIMNYRAGLIGGVLRVDPALQPRTGSLRVD